MKNIKAVIIDDEPRARQVLKKLIENTSHNFEIVGEASNLIEGVEQIKKTQPQVVFLDVQMPNYLGYEIVKFFDTIDFEIVFITAYDRYAIKAFEVKAIDYIVKPIERNRLEQTLLRLSEKEKLVKSIEDYHLLLESIKNKKIEKLIIPEIGNRKIVEISRIKVIEANGAYTIFHLDGEENFITSKNLKYFETKLRNDDRFSRVHRTYIINVNYIESLNKTRQILVLKDGMNIKIARNRISAFEKNML